MYGREPSGLSRIAFKVAIAALIISIINLVIITIII